jgi:hypothetical protein
LIAIAVAAVPSQSRCWLVEFALVELNRIA